jgi:DNA-binding transcriptional LysR family regulator
MLPTGLRCFLVVAQAGSMREAAGRLRLAQSAISRRIQVLEEELGTQLLERGARGITLTPAGQVLLEHGRDALAGEERLRAELDALRGARRGHVVLRAVETFGAAELPEAVGTFRAAFPAVTLEVGIVGTEAVLAAVRERTCHLGIAFNPAPEEELEELGAAHEPVRAVMAPSHPLAGQAEVALRELTRFPLVLPTRLGRVRVMVDAAARASGVELRPMLETNCLPLLSQVLAGGDAVALLCDRPLLRADRGQLRAVPLRERAFAAGRMVLLARRGRRLPAAAAALAEELRRALARRGAAEARGLAGTEPDA